MEQIIEIDVMQLIEAVKNLLPTLGTNDKFLKNKSCGKTQLFL